MNCRDTVVPGELVCCTALFLVIRMALWPQIILTVNVVQAKVPFADVANVLVAVLGETFCAWVENGGFVDRGVGTGDTFGRVEMRIEDRERDLLADYEL